MAKTNPIGVRFDEELLKIIKETAGVSTPQKALNLYEEHFRGKIGGGGSNTRSSYVEAKVEDKPKSDPPPPENKTEEHEQKDEGSERPKLSPEQIKEEIVRLGKMEVPKDRNTRLGKISWEIEKKAKIEELKKQLL